MAKDTYWFRHDANAHEDLKIKALRKTYGMAGFGRYWYLIEALRSEADCKLEYSDLTFDSLSTDMDGDPSEIKKFIDDCISRFRLFAKNGGEFYSERLLREKALLDEKRDKTSKAGLMGAQKRYGKNYGASKDDPDKYTNGKFGHMVMK